MAFWKYINLDLILTSNIYTRNIGAGNVLFWFTLMSQPHSFIVFYKFFAATCSLVLRVRVRSRAEIQICLKLKILAPCVSHSSIVTHPHGVALSTAVKRQQVDSNIPTTPSQSQVQALLIYQILRIIVGI